MERLQTIEDYVNAFYGAYFRDLRKADAPVATSTSGAYNPLFGPGLWVQINLQANAYGVLPKEPYRKSGYRAVTAAASTSGAGISEGGAVPDAIKPTFKEVEVGVKDVATAFQMTSRELALQGKDDVPTWEELQAEQGKEFASRLDISLTADNGTLASNNIESIDRVCGSYSEVTNCTDSGDNAYTAGDLDIYSQDRDAAASWVDAYVSHNSGTDRTLTLSLINTLDANVRMYWDGAGVNNKVYATGFDTLSRWGELMQAQQRFMEVGKASISVNGINTLPGQETGFDVQKYKGIPVIPDKNVQQDTISRIYLLDLDYLKVAVNQPVQYFQSRDYQHLGKFVQEGLYYAQMELACTKFRAQAKLRDLK